GGGFVGRMDEGVRFATGEEQAPMIGVAGSQIVNDGVDDPLRRLRAAGAVQENGRPPVDLSIQGGKLPAKCCDIEHVMSLSFSREPLASAAANPLARARCLIYSGLPTSRMTFSTEWHPWRAGIKGRSSSWPSSPSVACLN